MPVSPNYRHTSFGTLLFLLMALGSYAQPKLGFNIKKPEKFKERQLGSEKMATKPFTAPRRFFQNTYTHYNYYFNANERLKEIVAEVADRKQEDYADLLPFYKYSLKETSGNAFLDSVIQTCTAGILLHDLRNDWIDNMYMLLGRAYLFKNFADSAAMTFQYINVSYAAKEEGGYDLPIGSNAGETGSSAFSVSTKEKTGRTAYLMSRPPSRNEALAWQVRAMVDMDNLLDASSLLNTLQNDPIFPERLKPLLSEHAAYLYYRAGAWDSSAKYLEISVKGLDSREAKARGYYLAGQMYALAEDAQSASDAFAKATELAIDPVLEVYARLNSLRLNKSKDPAVVAENIERLRQMAKKERFRDYNDIILYAAALMALEQGIPDQAETLLRQSLLSDAKTPGQKSKTAFTLGNLLCDQKQYGRAADPYDSVDASTLKESAAALLAVRKPATRQIADAETGIKLYDSLMQVAAMEEPARSELVKKVARDLRKKRGLKEESAGMAAAAAAAAASTDLFGSPTGAAATWYFADGMRRAQGFELFKQKWGARENTDNWRRSSAIRNAQVATLPAISTGQSVVDSTADVAVEVFDTTDISFDNLFSRLPLTPEKLAETQKRALVALYKKASALHEDLEDYPEAIKIYEEILRRTDSGDIARKSLFDLVHCYTATGNMAAAAAAKKKLEQGFPDATETKRLTGNVEPERPAASAVDQTYAAIYDLFLSGQFQEAMNRKQAIDSANPSHVWTPQLMYMEALYLVKEQKDSLAMKALDNLIAQHPNHPLKERATLLKEVLPRRAEIEAYLTKLDVTRLEDEPLRNPNDIIIPKAAPIAPSQQAVQSNKPTLQPKALADSTAPAIKANVVKLASPFVLEEQAPHTVAIYLPNIDPTYVNEVLYSLNTSPQKNYKGATVKVSKQKVRDGLWLVLLQSEAFSDASSAAAYVGYLRPLNTKTIIPWLEVTKYRYLMATEANLKKLTEGNESFDLYFQILHQAYPSQF